LKLGIPLPLFDRNGAGRSAAQARELQARAQLELARADVRAELQDSWLALRSADRAQRALASISGLIERGYAMLEKATRAGALNAVERAQAMRRANEAAAQLDLAVRDLRIARARWRRVASH
jgi:outer membrane protein TolC